MVRTCKKNNTTHTQRGMTLVELLVTMMIALLLGTIFFTQQIDYERTVLIKNNGYEVALAIREAQSRGVSVAASGVGRSGIYVEEGASVITIFDDLNKNDLYDPGSTPTEKVRDVTLDKSAYVVGLCGYIHLDPLNPNDWSWVCSEDVGDDSAAINQNIHSLGALFIRPDLAQKAYVYYDSAYHDVTAFAIHIRTRSGDKTVNITTTPIGYVQVWWQG